MFQSINEKEQRYKNYIEKDDLIRNTGFIYKMSNEIDTIPRSGLQEYAPPISPKLNEAILSGSINLENEEDLEQFISEVKKVQKCRYSGLNLLNINNGKIQ